jgi:hypothetical protein
MKKLIVPMEVTKERKRVATLYQRVIHAIRVISSAIQHANAFRVDGNATMLLIVKISRMKKIAHRELVRNRSLNAMMVAASKDH